jgi:hypothetical protein
MCPAARLVALSTALGLLVGPFALSVRAQAPAPPPQNMSALPPAPPGDGAPAGAIAGAVAVNVIRIPGKTVLCGLGSLGAGALMLLTMGTQYRAAGSVLREGCGGKWVIGPYDLDRDVDPPRAIFSGGLSSGGSFSGSP